MQIRDLIPWSRGKVPAQGNTSHNDNPVNGLQRDINRVFDDFWSQFDRPLGSSPSPVTNGLLSGFGPRSDVSETDKEVEVSVELPGLDEKDIDVSLTGDMLTIRGEKKAEKEEKRKGYYLSERSYGSFHRSVPLPPGVDTDKATAEFKRGVLTVTMPKTPESQAQVKRIEVKAT